MMIKVQRENYCDVGTPHKDKQSQLTWIPGALRDWTTNQEQAWAGPRPRYKYVADVQLCLHVGLEQLELGLASQLLPVMGCVLLAGMPCLTSVGEEEPRISEIWCARKGSLTQEVPHQFRQEGEREWEKDCRRGFGSGQWAGCKVNK